MQFVAKEDIISETFLFIYGFDRFFLSFEEFFFFNMIYNYLSFFFVEKANWI